MHIKADKADNTSKEMSKSSDDEIFIPLQHLMQQVENDLDSLIKKRESLRSTNELYNMKKQLHGINKLIEQYLECNQTNKKQVTFADPPSIYTSKIASSTIALKTLS